MGKKINVAELLKDCPQGMELDCTLFDDVKFETVVNNSICIRLNNGESFTLSPYGNCIGLAISKCVIFPKGKTTWEGFVPPCAFKDGDIITCTNVICSFVAIFKKQLSDKSFKRYAVLTLGNNPHFKYNIDISDFIKPRFATEEEKQKLFDAIKANGFTWNSETKTLEKLIEPKFKVGDVIQDIDSYKVKITEVNIEDECYGYESVISKGIGGIGFNEQDNWKLVPNKFDITTLKPFDKVLTRANDNNFWVCNLYSHRIKDYYVVLNAELARQCIPYEGNEHLLGTANDCDSYYITWEE